MRLHTELMPHLGGILSAVFYRATSLFLFADRPLTFRGRIRVEKKLLNWPMGEHIRVVEEEE